MLRDRTDRAWFSRLLRHPASKHSGSILTIPEAGAHIGLLFVFPCLCVDVVQLCSKFANCHFAEKAKHRQP